MEEEIFCIFLNGAPVRIKGKGRYEFPTISDAENYVWKELGTTFIDKAKFYMLFPLDNYHPPQEEERLGGFAVLASLDDEFPSGGSKAKIIGFREGIDDAKSLAETLKERNPEIRKLIRVEYGVDYFI